MGTCESIVGQVILGEISKRCKGAGICKVLVDFSKPILTDMYCQRHRAQATITKESEDKLLFSFEKNSMSQETTENFFSTSKFVMKTSYLIEQEISKKFSMKRGLIREGDYIIHENSLCFDVKFKIYFLDEKIPSSDTFINKRWIVNDRNEYLFQ